MTPAFEGRLAVTVIELAEALGYGDDFVRRAIWRGDLAVIGKRTAQRILVKDIEPWLESLRPRHADAGATRRNPSRLSREEAGSQRDSGDQVGKFAQGAGSRPS